MVWWAASESSLATNMNTYAAVAECGSAARAERAIVVDDVLHASPEDVCHRRRVEQLTVTGLYRLGIRWMFIELAMPCL